MCVCTALSVHTAASPPASLAGLLSRELFCCRSLRPAPYISSPSLQDSAQLVQKKMEKGAGTAGWGAWGCPSTVVTCRTFFFGLVMGLVLRSEASISMGIPLGSGMSASIISKGTCWRTLTTPTSLILGSARTLAHLHGNPICMLRSCVACVFGRCIWWCLKVSMSRLASAGDERERRPGGTPVVLESSVEPPRLLH